MKDKDRHLYADYICVVLMIIGLSVTIFNNLGSIIFITGIVGMIINEKVNPFDKKI